MTARKRTGKRSGMEWELSGRVKTCAVKRGEARRRKKGLCWSEGAIVVLHGRKGCSEAGALLRRGRVSHDENASNFRPPLVRGQLLDWREQSGADDEEDQLTPMLLTHFFSFPPHSEPRTSTGVSCALIFNFCSQKLKPVLIPPGEKSR